MYKKRQAALAVSVYSKIYEVQLVITNLSDCKFHHPADIYPKLREYLGLGT